MILHASIPSFAPNDILAALVLAVDTIPKPDGLGMLTRSTDIGPISNDVGSRLRKIECCSIMFDLESPIIPPLVVAPHNHSPPGRDKERNYLTLCKVGLYYSNASPGGLEDRP
jgi:hypothetical protein